MKNCHLHLSAVFYLVIGPEIFAVEVTIGDDDGGNRDLACCVFWR